MFLQIAKRYTPSSALRQFFRTIYRVSNGGHVCCEIQGDVPISLKLNIKKLPRQRPSTKANPTDWHYFYP